MRSIVWADAALQDFATIDEWYVGKDVEYANRVAIAAVQAARRLVQFPEIGEKIGSDTRKWTVTGTEYRLIYRVSADSIEILRVRHASEDRRGRP